MIVAKEYINKIHGESKGYITKSVISKMGDYNQYHYSLKNLIKQDFTSENIYITLNTFYKPQRRIENIKELNALYIDLDIYNSEYYDYTPEQIAMCLKYEHFGNGNNEFPTPSYIIKSGRGLYLIWRIEVVPSMALPLWKAIQEFLYNKLKEFGADKKALDATRILRVPGSVNSKSNSQVKILMEFNVKYKLRQIQVEYLPPIEKKEHKRGRPKKIYSLYRDRSLYFERLKDLIKICELRNYDLRGNREYILFLYRYYTCYFSDDTEKALNDIIELNNKFIYPLKKREVIRATKSAETAYQKDKQYKYKNKTLIEILNITEYEQKQLNTIIDNQEYKRRKSLRNKEDYKNNKEKLKALGKITQQEQIENKQKKVLNLLRQGLKRKDICDILNMSFKTYERYLKILKEKGFI